MMAQVFGLLLFMQQTPNQAAGYCLVNRWSSGKRTSEDDSFFLSLSVYVCVCLSLFLYNSKLQINEKTF